jgi:hypothetical protein
MGKEVEYFRWLRHWKPLSLVLFCLLVNPMQLDASTGAKSNASTARTDRDAPGRIFWGADIAEIVDK